MQKHTKEINVHSRPTREQGTAHECDTRPYGTRRPGKGMRWDLAPLDVSRQWVAGEAVSPPSVRVSTVQHIRRQDGRKRALLEELACT